MKKDMVFINYNTHRVFKKFEKHCENTGLELLSDDIRFIKKTCRHIGLTKPDELRPVLWAYYSKYMEALEAEKNEIKKQNSGRQVANLYLLKLLEG